MKSIERITAIIKDVDKTMKSPVTETRRRNFSIDKQLLSERMRQDHMREVIDELE